MNFLNELIARWVGESPTLFKWITRISWLFSAIILIPQYIDAMQNEGIPFPETWEKVILTIVGYASIGAGIIAKLTLTKAAKEKEGIKD